MAKRAKRRGPGKRYTAAQKAKILAAAKKERLTGDQVAKRFSVSTLTFYRWRGPVRKDAVRRAGRRGLGRPKGSGKIRLDVEAVRREVRAQLAKMLPAIIREEIARALSG
jgi:transposase-like protein